jgi:hypothetical protein
VTAVAGGATSGALALVPAMVSALVFVPALLAALALLAVLAWRARGRWARAALPAPGPRRILFPFLARTLSEPALEAALRLARAEHATLVPIYLAEVPLHLPLDCALPHQSATALALLEAVEQRAHRCGVPVDARIERGRDARHALRELLAHERRGRIVLAAATDEHGNGFSPLETAWVLEHAPGEVVVLRPGRANGASAPVLRESTATSTA